MKLLYKIIKVVVKSLFSFDPAIRRKNRYKAINYIARKIGFFTYNYKLSWFANGEFCETYEEFYDTFPLSDTKLDSKFALMNISKACPIKLGHTAECGVASGGTSFLICSATKETRPKDHLHHCFDSFEGLSKYSEEDKIKDKEYNITEWRKGKKVGVEIPKQNLSKFDEVRFYKGWIPEKFEEVSDEQFSLVHIDVNLYEPTINSICFFYPRIVRGGFIICDDYGFESCPGARRAINEFMEDKSETIIEIPTGQCLIIKN